MKLDRSRNAVRNIQSGLLEKIVLILGPFIVRTVFIHTLGSEYLGLNGLFSSILTILNITELGIGSAIVFSMYQSIASDDTENINALLNFYRHLYLIVGSMMLLIGLVLIPFLPNLIDGEVPADISLTFIYVVFLVDSACSYFIFAHYTSLFYAFQRNDMLQKINMSVSIAKYFTQCLMLLLAKNYYWYVVTLPVFTITGSLIVGLVARKMFPDYRPNGMLSNETKIKIKSKVSGVLADKVLGISRNSFDTIFISLFLGLTSVAIYSNHIYILNAVSSIMLVLLGAIAAGVGNSVATESVSKNYHDMKRINFIYMWIGSCCTVCLVCLYTPFMTLWAGEEMTLQSSSVILISAVFYVLKMCDVRYTYVQATGLFREIRVYAVVETLINILLNYVLGRKYGINGIIAATLFSLFVVNFCFRSTVLFRKYFSTKELKEFYSFHALFAFVTALACLISFYVCNYIAITWPLFFIRGFVCVGLANIVLMIVYRRTRLYKESASFLLDCTGLSGNTLIYKLLLS